MQKVDDNILINLCILPPKNVGKQCEMLSQSLKSNDTLFVLGDGKFAHMTIYMARFPRQHVPKLIQAAQQTLTAEESFLCTHTGYFMTDGRYFEVSYRKSPEFLALHDNLIKNLKDFRANPGKPLRESYFGPYNSQQQQNAKETGYDLAYDLYRPHITLTRYAENKVPKDMPTMPPAELSFEYKTIGMYEADDNGAVFKKLAEFTI